nr:phage antirepressor KilAC domain-containing protein [Corynebacterium endometrii]
MLQSDSLITTTEIAKDYGLSAKKLNLLLHDAGVQFNVVTVGCCPDCGLLRKAFLHLCVFGRCN